MTAILTKSWGRILFHIEGDFGLEFDVKKFDIRFKKCLRFKFIFFILNKCITFQSRKDIVILF